MLPVARFGGVEPFGLLVKQPDDRSRCFLVAVDRDKRAIVRRHRKQRSRLWAGGPWNRAEITLDEIFDLLLVEISHRNDSHQVRTVPCVVKAAKGGGLVR